MAAPSKIENWDAAFDEFILVHKPKGMKQYEFAALKQVDAEWMSTKFSEIRNERLMTENRSRMPKLLSRGLDEMESTLDMVAGIKEDEPGKGISQEFKSKMGLEAAKFAADRLGMSPQAVTINMQQLNQSKIVIAPLFDMAPSEIDKPFTIDGDMYPPQEEKKDG